MTDSDWAKWVTHHATLFWMTSEQDGALFAAWKPSLIGYELAELTDASTHIATDSDKSKVFRTVHLGLLRGRIQARRYERARAEQREFDRAADMERCKLCDGNGLVWVPHPENIVDDCWQHPHYQFVVACSCNRGSGRFNAVNAKLAEANKLTRLMDLQTYEVLYPHWQDLLESRRVKRIQEREAHWRASEADRISPLRKDITAALKKIKAPESVNPPSNAVSPVKASQVASTEAVGVTNATPAKKTEYKNDDEIPF